MRAACVVLALAPFFGGCAEGPASPATALAEGRSATGLEQVLEVEAAVSDGVGRFTITSTLVNAGAEPVTVTVRSCYLRDADLRGETAGLRLHEPLMLCASGGHEITLAPGEASEPLGISGEMAPDGRHELKVRHALKPERWGSVTLQVP